MITLQNGFPQGSNGLIVPNGSIKFQLNVDATVIAPPGGFVAADIPVVFQFDKNGALIQPAKIWSNEELDPQNTEGLGTFYLVTFYDQNGAILNATPLWWIFPEIINSTVDISQMVAISTVGGNVIYYPRSIGGAGTVTSVAFVGDGTILSATPSTPVTTSGNITATLLTQNALTFLAGPTTPGPAAAPTFRTIVSADIPVPLSLSASAITAALTLINPTAATSLANQNSPSLVFEGQAWNGSASVADSWSIEDTIVSGTSTLLLMHTGSGVAAATVQTDSLSLGATGAVSGILSLLGVTSGMASLTAAATAGTPNALALPTVNPVATGQVLSAQVGNPTQLGWSYVSALLDPNSVSVRAFGAKFDGRICSGNVDTIVSDGTSTVTCNHGNFTSDDVGKQFTATTGCCGVGANYAGVSLLSAPGTATTILSVTNSTTIVVSQNVTACTGATCLIAWATNDDTAISAAETAWQSLGKCGTLVLPAGITATLQPHFTNPGAECLAIAVQDDYSAQVVGAGKGATIVGVFPGFNFAGCPAAGCFGGYLEQTWRDFQINGFGWGNTGIGSGTILIGTGLGSELIEFACNATGGSDANLTGVQSKEGTRVWGLSIDGCGKTGWEISGSVVKSYYSFVGDNLGPAVVLDDNADLTDVGSDYGGQGGTVLIQLGNTSRYHGIGSNLFGNTATSGSLFYLPGTNATVILEGCRFNNTATTSNGIYSASATNSVVLAAGTIIGGSSVGIGGSAKPKLTMDSTATILTNGAAQLAVLTGTGACATVSLSAQKGGIFTGSVACGGVTGASTLTITPGTTALNGWICTAIDVSSGTALPQTSSSTTACTIGGTVTSADVVNFTAIPF